MFVFLPTRISHINVGYRIVRVHTSRVGRSPKSVRASLRVLGCWETRKINNNKKKLKTTK